jgi:hypothetical protein
MPEIRIWVSDERYQQILSLKGLLTHEQIYFRGLGVDVAPRPLGRPKKLNPQTGFYESPSGHDEAPSGAFSHALDSTQPMTQSHEVEGIDEGEIFEFGVKKKRRAE